MALDTAAARLSAMEHANLFDVIARSPTGVNDDDERLAVLNTYSGFAEDAASSSTTFNQRAIAPVIYRWLARRRH